VNVINTDILAVMGNRAALDRHTGRRDRHGDAACGDSERIASGIDIDSAGGKMDLGAVIVVNGYIASRPSLFTTATISECQNNWM
jgi:hypothetical protein